jgi:hypothetical protein
MASNRIIIDTTKNTAARLQDFIGFGSLFREKLAEWALILGIQGYNGDASLATALGCSAADQTRLQNIVIQANNEMNGLVAQNVPVGQPTWTRQLLDALSTSG